MGLVRLALALVVVAAHAFPAHVMPGSVAVELFFVISGYLISFVLIEAKAYSRVRDFWAARYLRLWPVYAVVAAVTVVVSLALYSSTGHNRFIETFAAAPPGAKALLAVVNLVIVGQDWTLFLGVSGGQLGFTTNFWDSEVLMPFGLAVPPAWSLGIELTFYAIAPFVLRRRAWIFGLLAASIALRAALLFGGLGTHDPWSYRFFPTELAFFLLGVIAHQWLSPRLARAPQSLTRLAAPVLIAVILALAVAWHGLPGPDVAKVWPTALLLAASLPLLVAFQKTRRWDRVLGDLSYPVYVVHWLVIVVVTSLAGPHGAQLSRPVFLAAVLVPTLVFAWLLERYVGVPVDRWRRRFRDRAAA